MDSRGSSGDTDDVTSAPAVPASRKRLGKRIRRALARQSIALAAIVVPRLYLAYMWLVDVTSRHDDTLLTPLMRGCVARHDRVVAVLWHQEVFTVAWNYRHLHGHTLASVSDFGEIIAGMLRLCNFTVFRGGSGSRSRRRDVLAILVEHMQTHHDVMYGITVDGSNGPVYVMKPGGVLIGQACRAPLVAVRTWYSRAITLKTWDHAQIPLPFTRRVTLATGPYWLAPDADAAAVEAFRRHMEEELLDLAARAYERLDLASTPAARFGFPAGWTPRWKADQLGSAAGPWDLDPDRPPPWANRRMPVDRASDTSSSRIS